MRKFTEIKESLRIDFNEAFDLYIKGQEIKDQYTFVKNYATYLGVLLRNGYKYVSYGGGCSGEDCNTTLIISPKDEIVAENEW